MSLLCPHRRQLYAARKEEQGFWENSCPAGIQTIPRDRRFFSFARPNDCICSCGIRRATALSPCQPATENWRLAQSRLLCVRLLLASLSVLFAVSRLLDLTSIQIGVLKTRGGNFPLHRLGLIFVYSSLVLKSPSVSFKRSIRRTERSIRFSEIVPS